MKYVPKEMQGSGAYCPSGHLRCMNCAYSIVNYPSTYRDFSGGSYIYTDLSTSKLNKCGSGHEMILSKTYNENNLEYTCLKCGNKHLFDN